MSEKSKASSSTAEKELDRVAKQFDEFDQKVKGLTLDRMNEAPKMEREVPVMAQKEGPSKDIYLKPRRSISCSPKDTFNEKFRKEYEYRKEYVYFTAYNHELVGSSIEKWTRPYPGLSAEEWEVPTGRPVWGPRYLAEEIKNCVYHKLSMDETKTTGVNAAGTTFGQIVVDNVVQRLDAVPATKAKSIFMGTSDF